MSCICCIYIYISLRCVHRPHRPEYEGHRPKLLLLQLQQSRTGRRRRRSLGSAQPSGGDGGEAAHRRVPGVSGLPAPLSRRAGKPDPAAELSPSQTVPRPFFSSSSSSVALSHSVWDGLSHTKTEKYTSDAAVHSGSCRYRTFTYSHMFLCFGRARTYHRLKNVYLCIWFTLTLVPCYL